MTDELGMALRMHDVQYERANRLEAERDAALVRVAELEGLLKAQTTISQHLHELRHKEEAKVSRVRDIPERATGAISPSEAFVRGWNYCRAEVLRRLETEGHDDD